MLAVSHNTKFTELAYGSLGALVTLWAILHVPASWYLTTALLAILVAAASPFSIRMRDPIRLPGAMPIEVATMLVAPPAVSIVVAAVNSVVTSLWYKRPPVRTFFNVANLAVPNALGTAVLALAIHPWPQALNSPWHLLAATAAIIMRMMANMAGQSLLRGVEARRSMRELFVSAVKEEWRTGGFGLRLMPLMMALAYPVIGWWTLVPGALLQISIGASMRRYQDRVESQTLTDGLTNLGNRKAWEQYRQTTEAEQGHLVAIIDVDGLKRVNDNQGHETGDAVLVDVARRLTHAALEGDVYRLGGDEFLVVLPDRFDPLRGRRAIEDQLLDFGHHWQAKGYVVSASVGFAIYPDEAPDMRGAMTLADQRMYQMKHGNGAAVGRQ